MGKAEPRLSQFGPALAWLLDRDVSSGRLAVLFDTTAENVRVSAYRARHSQGVTPPAGGRLGDPVAIETAERLGIRPDRDEVVETPLRLRKIDLLEAKIETTVQKHAAAYSFLEGVRRLREIIPYIGYAGQARRVALSARLHQHLAWFLVHAGQCVSSAEEAATARDLYRFAYREAPCREYADSFVKSALIGAHACLLMRCPHEALSSLSIARSAAESVGAPVGSDHFRQRGVALFQLREDQQAAEAFRQSAAAMERYGEAKVPAQIVMTGVRHIHLLGSVNWDGALEVLELARQAFGDQSLEASMALHWATACGVSIDNDSIPRQAVEMAASNPGIPAQFGHQLTIRKLLGITPELGFDARLRRAWARRTLYENAFRQQ